MGPLSVWMWAVRSVGVWDDLAMWVLHWWAVLSMYLELGKRIILIPQRCVLGSWLLSDTRDTGTIPVLYICFLLLYLLVYDRFV